MLVCKGVEKTRIKHSAMQLTYAPYVPLPVFSGDCV